ncbi:hypothetical protein HMPREF1503_0601 [Olsenella uli MSTE5]|nr:hypothetical protein HMPREF1503_0601 [Olsenella uli MSTE5]
MIGPSIFKGGAHGHRMKLQPPGARGFCEAMGPVPYKIGMEQIL